jgi:5'-nucleotidase (lipoprotein e(P4) family)
MRIHILVLPTLLLFLSSPLPPASAQTGTGLKSLRVPNEALNATLWTQTSVEYGAVARGMYSLAHLRLDQALTTPDWTASLEQFATGRFSDLPPAVVLDADETVLDNSAYQARLIQDGEVFTRDNWDAWVQEADAGVVPGALDFTRYASSRGVRVIYMTNRSADQEAATRNNLIALGFPVSDDDDGVLTRGERPEWRSSNKSPRRKYVAESYRILLLIGDNFGDFSDASRGSLSDRSRASENYTSWWGKKWIVLPNPQYGSWESALFGGDYSLSQSDRLEQKFNSLQTGR